MGPAGCAPQGVALRGHGRPVLHVTTLGANTSLLRYPVFVKDDDYRGSPDMTKSPLLRKYLLENFVAEVEELKDAVFAGLGPQVQKALDCLIQERVLKPERVIGGSRGWIPQEFAAVVRR